MIIVIDFGSQTAHLIARRLNDLGYQACLISPDKALSQLRKGNIKGIVLSGGPASVYSSGAPTVDKKIFSLGIPILGICYGLQLMSYLLGGIVKKGKIKEYGPADLVMGQGHKNMLFSGFPKISKVWMSHGDEVEKAPQGFDCLASTENIKVGAISDGKRRLFGIQFHPEVEHTECGNILLENFGGKICRELKIARKNNVDVLVGKIKEKIQDGRALAAVSGGLDSTLAAFLVAKAIGKRLIPVHVDNGLMRPGTTEEVRLFFKNHLGIKPHIISCQGRFLKALKGITDPEKKRKIIGSLYIEIFEEVIRTLGKVRFLVQGTIFSDVIESSGSKHADNIKSHHNVGGLPEKLKLLLVEPLRDLYTDEVRKMAGEVGIPEGFITKQPHPGPGYAIRVMGELTKMRLEMVKIADRIVMEEMIAGKLENKLLHSFAVLTGARSTAVKGDGRFLGEVVAIRAVSSTDRMTAAWAHLPYEVLQKISSRIINEVPLVSRVVYDISTKPPSTMEWE